MRVAALYDRKGIYLCYVQLPVTDPIVTTGSGAIDATDLGADDGVEVVGVNLTEMNPDMPAIDTERTDTFFPFVWGPPADNDKIAVYFWGTQFDPCTPAT